MVLGLLFAMPFIGKWKLGHRFNLGLLGIILISATLLSFALGRRFDWSTTQLTVRWLSLVVVSVAALLLVPRSGIPVFSAQVLVWWVLEVRPRSAPSAASRRWLRWMIGCFLAGFGFWLADKTRLACDPDNHLLNGHAVWHLATSACLGFFFEYESSQRRP